MIKREEEKKILLLELAIFGAKNRSFLVLCVASNFAFQFCILLLLSRSSRVRLCDPVDGSPPGSPVPGILQARILERVAILFSRGSSRPRDQTQASYIAGGFFTN